MVFHQRHGKIDPSFNQGYPADQHPSRLLQPETALKAILLTEPGPFALYQTGYPLTFSSLE